MMEWFALAVIAATLLLLALRRSIESKYLAGVPFYEHHPILGIWPALFRNMHRYYDWKLVQAERAQSEGAELVQRVGPFLGVVEVHSPRMLQYLLKDNFDNFEKGARFRSIFAEFLGDGIFNSDGEQWRSQRKIASHMFSAAKLNSCMLDTFVDRSATVLDLLFEQLDRQNAAAAASPAGPVPHLDFQALMHGYNMDSIMQIGFGLQLDSMRASTPPSFVAAFDRLQENIVYRFLGPPLKWRLLRCLGIGREKEVARALPVIDEFVYSLVRARKENADKYVDSGDLLSLFVASDAKAKTAAAAKADTAGAVVDATGAAADVHAQPVSGEDAAASSGLSDRELRDIILNFMLAGRDTTASLLTWLFYELSQHPQVERRVIEEVEGVFGAVDTGDKAGERADAIAAATTNINQETLRQLVYLEAVIMETLRLHPPVPANNKRAIGTCTFPDGTRIPAGTLVSFSPYLFGRMESIWGADALDFNPDRFLSDADANGARTLVQPSAYAFPAFHCGFRLCLGRGMALLNAKTLASSVLRLFRLRTRPGHDPAYRLSIVMTQKNGLPVTVMQRERE